MKPIEPGCLAIITGGEFFHEHGGDEVRVIEFCDKGSWHTYLGEPFIMDKGCWGVEVLRTGDTIPVENRHLLRIDGGEFVTTEHDEEVGA